MHYLYDLFFVPGTEVLTAWIPLAIGLGAGLLKNIEGQNRASGQRKAQAEIQRWSPYTGMQGQMVQDPSLIGDVATGAAIGSMGEGMMPKSSAASMGPTGEFSGGAVTPQNNPYNSSLFQQTPSSWLPMAKQMNSPYSLYSK